MLRFKHVSAVQVCSCHALPENLKGSKVSLVRSSCWGHHEGSPQFPPPGKPVTFAVCAAEILPMSSVLWSPPLSSVSFPSHPHLAGKPWFFFRVHWKKIFSNDWKFSNFFSGKKSECVLLNSNRDSNFRAFCRAVTAPCTSLPPSPPLSSPGWKILAPTLEGGAPQADVATSELLRNPRWGCSASLSLTWGFMNFNEQYVINLPKKLG